MKSTSLFFGFTSSHRVEPCFFISFSGHDTAYPVLANYDFPKFCESVCYTGSILPRLPPDYKIHPLSPPPPPPMQDWQALQITELLASTELPQFSVHQILQQTAQDIVSAKHLQYRLSLSFPISDVCHIHSVIKVVISSFMFMPKWFSFSYE